MFGNIQACQGIYIARDQVTLKSTTQTYTYLHITLQYKQRALRGKDGIKVISNFELQHDVAPKKLAITSNNLVL